MEKRATIKDIAERAKVSSGTVHRALYGKPGVGEEVRARILVVAEECGYRPNYVASSLKRKTLRMIAAFPVPAGQNRFFYTHMWHGFRDAIQELTDYNIEVIELPYDNAAGAQSRELQDIWERYAGEIDGLLTVGRADERGGGEIRRYVEEGVPVVLACDDLRECGRLCCVQANYDVTGRMAAELLSSQLPKGAQVLLCAGDVVLPSHYKVVEGFVSFNEENERMLDVSKLYGYENEEALSVRLKELLQQNPPAAIFSVTARGSVLAASLLRETGLIKQVRLVASDLFPENSRNLREGVVDNILFKDPHRQAFLATKLLADYMIRGERPARETRYVDSIMIFRSNLSMYDTV